jgi:hypothetical protein
VSGCLLSVVRCPSFAIHRQRFVNESLKTSPRIQKQVGRKQKAAGRKQSHPLAVIPAEAGIRLLRTDADPRFRGGDDVRLAADS